MAAPVAMNGLGRIGRATLRSLLDVPDPELLAVNDIGEADNLAYLLAYDTVYGRGGRDFRVEGPSLVVDDRSIRVLAEMEPAALPWADLGVDVVFESTGVFLTADQMCAQLEAGARRVVLSAPATDHDVTTVVRRTLDTTCRNIEAFARGEPENVVT